ncbi:MAG: D-alanyl-D-alanine carboxypeptidase/D-alanyl-D-alanine-endopeptidase [Solirubrobacteraceae bacterium]
MLRTRVQAGICALFAVLAASPAAHAITVQTLRAKLAAQQRNLSSTSGAYVRDLVTGRTLYSTRADRTRSPASNEKLLVTSTALLKYGPDARLRTILEAESDPVDGVIDGDVALVGAGDPYLTTTRLRSIAGQLKAQGVEEITGKVLGDGTFFDNRRGSYDSAYAYDPDLGGSLGGLVLDYGRGPNPAQYAAEKLRDTLLAADIIVRKGPHAGTLGEEGVPVASVTSDPISTILAKINVPSDNFAAEMLLKTLGGAFGTAGTTTAGATVVRETLAELGVTARPYDGSGLSRADQVSPREITDLLTEMAALPGTGLALRSSLPVAGKTGTLASRMRGTAAAGRCRAKTGTLRSVSALSGYCATPSGHLVAFSFLENNMSEYTAKQVEDRMVAQIARYSDASR